MERNIYIDQTKSKEKEQFINNQLNKLIEENNKVQIFLIYS